MDLRDKWISLPCLFKNETIEANFRLSYISFAKKWNGDDSSSALYIYGRNSPIRIILPMDTLEAKADLMPFVMANGEKVLINDLHVCYYRDFIDEQSKEGKYILFLPPITSGHDNYFIVTTPFIED